MKKALSLIATGLALVATAVVSTASVVFINQPKVPEELLK